MPDDRDYTKSPVYEKAGGNVFDKRTDKELNARYRELQHLGNGIEVAAEMFGLLHEWKARDDARKALAKEAAEKPAVT